MSFPNFFGNTGVADTLAHMIRSERIPQTILLDGPDGVGKATLARRFATELLQRADPASAQKIENDDLSLPHNLELIAEREKLASDKRADDPLYFSTHPDFLTFAPDGPLRQIAIQQMRLLKERAAMKPLRGRWRVFLIDHIDRANEQAANSLLKTLEEPPEHLILLLTAENPYDLLPTIRSRSVQFHLGPLHPAEMSEFLRGRGLDGDPRLVSLAAGSPGAAVAMDLEAFDRRRAAMWTLLEAAAGKAPFADWMKHSESIAARKTEKLEYYLNILYLLLEDLLVLQSGGDAVRNSDLREELQSLAVRVSFAWIRQAVAKTDELVELLRRNIQKGIALDSLVLELRSAA